jgi:CRP-like cAMP-binding protein
MAISIDVLKRISLFSDLDNRELKSIASTLRDRRFAAGDTVSEEGKSGVGFFVIESGEAIVSIGGKEVRRLGPGDSFGEVALIADVPRSATIVAETDLLCHGLTPWEFRPIVEANGSLAWKLLQTLAQRLAAAQPSR